MKNMNIKVVGGVPLQHMGGDTTLYLLHDSVPQAEGARLGFIDS